MTNRRVALPPRAWRPVWWRLAVVTISVAAVIALTVIDTAVACGAADMRSLHFGAPLAWVVQESSLDPPVFPARIAFSDPHETVTAVLPLQLVVDIAVVTALLLAVWTVLAAGAARARDQSAQLRGQHSPTGPGSALRAALRAADPGGPVDA